MQVPSRSRPPRLRATTARREVTIHAAWARIQSRLVTDHRVEGRMRLWRVEPTTGL